MVVVAVYLWVGEQNQKEAVLLLVEAGLLLVEAGLLRKGIELLPKEEELLLWEQEWILNELELRQKTKGFHRKGDGEQIQEPAGVRHKMLRLLTGSWNFYLHHYFLFFLYFLICSD